MNFSFINLTQKSGDLQICHVQGLMEKQTEKCHLTWKISWCNLSCQNSELKASGKKEHEFTSKWIIKNSWIADFCICFLPRCFLWFIFNFHIFSKYRGGGILTTRLTLMSNTWHIELVGGSIMFSIWFEQLSGANHDFTQIHLVQQSSGERKWKLQIPRKISLCAYLMFQFVNANETQRICTVCCCAKEREEGGWWKLKWNFLSIWLIRRVETRLWGSWKLFSPTHVPFKLSSQVVRKNFRQFSTFLRRNNTKRGEKEPESFSCRCENYLLLCCLIKMMNSCLHAPTTVLSLALFISSLIQLNPHVRRFTLLTMASQQILVSWVEFSFLFACAG